MTTMRVSVRRFDTESGRRVEDYDVDVSRQASVLDVLRAIVADHDSTLSYRSACRVGMCGTCAIVIDGREGLACQTSAQRSTKATLRLEPLRNLPVVKDLVVDPTPFFEKYRAIHPAGRADEAGVGDADSLASGDCITCGACLSACTMATVNDGFVGPAALFRALRLVDESPQIESDERLRMLADADGMYGCRGHLDCLRACPKDLPLPQVIHKLKRLAARRVVTGSAAR